MSEVKKNDDVTETTFGSHETETTSNGHSGERPPGARTPRRRACIFHRRERGARGKPKLDREESKNRNSNWRERIENLDSVVAIAIKAGSFVVLATLMLRNPAASPLAVAGFGFGGGLALAYGYFKRGRQDPPDEN